MDMGAYDLPRMRGAARLWKRQFRARLFGQNMPMAGPRQCLPAAPALDGEAPFAGRLWMMVALLLARALASMTLDLPARIPTTLHHGADRWVYLERPIPRSKKVSPSRFFRRRRASSCSNIATTRSNQRDEAARLFGDTATLFGFWTVYRSASLSGNCRFFPLNGFQVRITLDEALQTGCSPL